jgi:endonuclease-3
MAKNHSSSSNSSSGARRSTRSRTRPVIFSGMPSRDDETGRISHPPSLVSPEPVASSSSSSTAAARKKLESIPRPDTPVSSVSISEAKAAAMKMAMATASIGNKRKRTASGGASKTQMQVRPTPEECEFAVWELGKLHPDVIEKCREIREQTTITTNVASDCKIDKDIVKDIVPEGIGSSSDNSASKSGDGCDQTNLLDGVFSTMLSQNTTAANSTRAFGNFKKAVPDWNLVVVDFDGYQETIETAIHCGGLAQIKAANIIRLCKTVYEETGSVSLEYLRDKSNKAIQKDLLRHKGLGPKTVSCVLLFTLGRTEFPVDTHVYRISKQNNWIPNSGMSRDAAYEFLNEIIPDHLKLELHCLLVQHGRECHRCAARGKPQFPPKDGSKLICPLVHLNAIVAATNVVKNGKLTKIKSEL